MQFHLPVSPLFHSVHTYLEIFENEDVFSPFNKRSVFRALKRRFSKTISTPEWRSFEALASHFCVDEFIHHTLLALYFACCFRNAIVFPAFLFGRRAKTTQLRYIWTRIIYLFIYFRFQNHPDTCRQGL